MQRISYIKTFLLWSAVLVFFCAWGGIVFAESTSENYVLDRAMLGPVSTPDATSTSYRTDAGGAPVFYQDEESVATSGESTGRGGGSGGRRAVPLPDHVYANESPLILREGQSGTLFQHFSPSNTYGTLYVPVLSIPLYNKGDTISFSVFREPFPLSQKNIFGNESIFENSLYRITALNAGLPVSRLDRYLTFIIENSASSFAGRSLAAYYFHPTLFVWIQIPQIVVREHSVLIQASYATDYVLIENPKELPPLLRTENTKNVPDEVILREIEGEVKEIQEQETQRQEARTQAEDKYNSVAPGESSSFIAFFLEKILKIFETMSLLQKIILAGATSAFLGLLLVFILKIVHR